MTPLCISETIISEPVLLVFLHHILLKMAELQRLIAASLQEGKEKFVVRVNGLKDTQELKDVVADLHLRG